MSDQAEATGQCPFCKEDIKVDAVRCKHCHATIPEEKPAHRGVCPFCKENINAEAIRCKHCQADLSAAGSDAYSRKCACGGLARPGHTRAGAQLRLLRGVALPRLATCPGAIMEGSTMWCLYSSDAESCTYEQCGYV